jgi:hypothetical protein
MPMLCAYLWGLVQNIVSKIGQLMVYCLLFCLKSFIVLNKRFIVANLGLYFARNGIYSRVNFLYDSHIANEAMV